MNVISCLFVCVCASDVDNSNITHTQQHLSSICSLTYTTHTHTQTRIHLYHRRIAANIRMHICIRNSAT